MTTKELIDVERDKKDRLRIQRDKKDAKKAWLAEDITFEFFNLEEPGVPVNFAHGPTNDIKKYLMMHGGKYTESRSLVQHLESRQTPIWGFKPDGSGNLVKTLNGYKSRFQCRQLFE